MRYHIILVCSIIVNNFDVLVKTKLMALSLFDLIKFSILKTIFERIVHNHIAKLQAHYRATFHIPA